MSMGKQAKKKVVWGIIGAGGWAARRFAPAVVEAANAQLSAVLSRDIKRAKDLGARLGHASGFDDIQAFLAHEGLKAVWVASPTHCHAEHALAALRSGKHVLCEKPIGLNSTQCDDIVQACQKSTRLFGAGYVMRHHPTLKALRREWLEGKFGKPVAVQAHFLYAFKKPPAEWKQKLSTSGGWASNDIATHLIDLVLWLLGQPLEGYGWRASPVFGFESDDYFTMTLRFSGAKIAHIEAATGVAAGPPTLNLIGSKGYAILENTLLGEAGKLIRAHRGSAPTTEKIAKTNLYRHQVEVFSDAIQKGVPYYPDANDGLAAVAITETVSTKERLVPWRISDFYEGNR